MRIGMDSLQLALILNAFTSRISTKDLEDIRDAESECLRRQLNSNSASQVEAQNKSFEMVLKAVRNLTRHDQELIIDTISREVTRP